MWRRHIDQLISIPECRNYDGFMLGSNEMSSEEMSEPNMSEEPPQIEFSDEQLRVDPVTKTKEVSMAHNDDIPEEGDDPLPFISNDQLGNQSSNGGRRYPTRERRPPDRLTYS